MNGHFLSDLKRRWPLKAALLLGGFPFTVPMTGRADTASVVTAANTLLTTSTAQTSPYALTTPVSVVYSLTNDKKWTNLLGTPPDMM